MRSNTDYDMNGHQLKNAVLDRQPSGQAPAYKGQVAFDDSTGQLRYSPDGVTWVYYTQGNNNYSVGAPVVRIRTGSTGWTTCSDGFVLPSGSRNYLGLKASNVPLDFFKDQKLDAGIDLYIHRGHRHDNAASWNDQHRFTHPVSVANAISEDDERIANGIIPRRSMYRGSADQHVLNGPLAGNRQTFWNLYGASEGAWIAKDVNIAGHLRVGLVNVYEAFNVPSSVNFNSKALGPAASGRYGVQTKQTKNFYTTFGTKGFALYIAFAYSWRDMSHPDPRARICGPMSNVYRVSAYPWPVYEDWGTGKAAARDGFSFEIKPVK